MCNSSGDLFVEKNNDITILAEKWRYYDIDRKMAILWYWVSPVLPFPILILMKDFIWLNHFIFFFTHGVKWIVFHIMSFPALWRHTYIKHHDGPIFLEKCSIRAFKNYWSLPVLESFSLWKGILLFFVGDEKVFCFLEGGGTTRHVTKSVLKISKILSLDVIKSV